MVISFNGPNNCGKTTQINKFKNDLDSKTIRFFGDISKYEPFPQLDSEHLYKWWFTESSPEDFCDTIYKCLHLRNLDIELAAKSSLVLVDKGISNFDARVLSTLLVRGLTREASESLINNYKRKYNVRDIEDIKILFSLGNTINESFDISIKRKYDTSCHTTQSLYYIYEKKQHIILQQQSISGIYTIIDASKNDGEIYQHLRKLIFKEGQKPLRTEEKLKLEYFKYEGVVKLPSDYKIAKEYEEQIQKFYNNVIDEFEDNMLLFLISGSCGREDVYSNWSDIDIILAFKYCNYNLRKRLYEFVNQSPIKIGLTIYSKYEIETGMIDSKSVYSMYFLKIGTLQPSYYSSELNIPIYNMDYIIHRSRDLLCERIHELKRLINVSPYEPIDTKKLFKVISLILKLIMVINNKKIIQGYNNIFSSFSKLYNIPSFAPECFIKNETSDINLLKYADWITDYIINEI